MNDDAVVTLAAYRLLQTKRTGAPKRISSGAAHVVAMACLVSALMRAAERKAISRDLIEAIFDDAETISLDGVRPTDATGVIIQMWDCIEPGLPKGDDG